MSIEEVVEQLESLKVWESDLEFINEIIEAVKELDNLKKEAVYFIKQHEQATRAINRLRTSLNDETEQKLELLEEVNKLRKRVADLVLVLEMLLDLTRNHLTNADNYGVVQRAKEVLVTKSC